MPLLENPTSSSLSREQIVACVRKWGGLASDAALHPKCHYFTLPDLDGLIAYRQEAGCAIVFGNPMCAPADALKLVKAFQKFCQESQTRIVYLGVSKEFTQQVLEHDIGVAMEFGEELTIDPHHDPRLKKGGHASLVRQKIRHALKEDVSAREYREKDAQLEEAMNQVGEDWLKARQGPQVYISKVSLFSDPLGKRWFYAAHGEKVVGVLLMNRLQAQEGWLINRVMLLPDAPHGTPEMLVTTALETVMAEGCHYVTFGVVPLSALGQVHGLGSFGAWASRCLFQCAKRVFYFGGTKGFWDKFHPQNAPVYLIFNGHTVGVRDLIGLARALNTSF